MGIKVLDQIDYQEMSRLEENKLIIKAQDGDLEARNKLILNNLKLAYKYVLPYSKEIPIEDLINESVFGIIKAIQRFDVSLGKCFSTYVAWWIKGHVVRYWQNNRSTIRISAKALEQLNQKSFNKLSKEEQDKLLNKVSGANSLSLSELENNNTTKLDNISKDMNESILEMVTQEKIKEFVEQITKDLNDKDQFAISIMLMYYADKSKEIRELIGDMSINTFYSRKGNLFRKLKKEFQQEFKEIEL